MKASAQTTVNFFAENFAFIEDLFNASKVDNFIITNEVFLNRCRAAGVSAQRLEAYKIVIPLADGSYELNKRFTDFIAFLTNDFRLDLPDSIKKYQRAIGKIYDQITKDNLTLNKEKTPNQIIELTNGLMEELQEFGLQIEANTRQLFVESTNITRNKEQLSYTERIQKATHLIESYIEPLNNILSTEDTDSFDRQLLKIKDFANLQRYEQTSLGLRNQFQRLHQRISNVTENILKSSSIMAKDVTPLIDRLRVESEIMKGVETFLLDAKKGKIERTFCLYELKGKRSRNVYAKSFELSAKNIFDALKPQEPISLLDTGSPSELQDLWIFDKERYKEKMVRELPIENFFAWCYQSLQADAQGDIDSEKFYYLSSLLFEKDIQVDFLPADKFEITLSDYILQVPLIKVKSPKNDN